MFCWKRQTPHQSITYLSCGPGKFPRKVDFMLAGCFNCSNLQPPLGSAVFCCSKHVLESILWWEHSDTVDKLPAEHGDCCRFSCQCSDLTGSLQYIASCMQPTRNLQCVSTYISQIVTNLIRSFMTGYLTHGIGAIQVNDQLPMAVRDSQSGHVLIEATESCENRYLEGVSSVCCDNECKCADGLPASSRSHQCQVKQIALLGYPRG